MAKTSPRWNLSIVSDKNELILIWEIPNRKSDLRGAVWEIPNPKGRIETTDNGLTLVNRGMARFTTGCKIAARNGRANL